MIEKCKEKLFYLKKNKKSYIKLEFFIEQIRLLYIVLYLIKFNIKQKLILKFNKYSQILNKNAFIFYKFNLIIKDLFNKKEKINEFNKKQEINQFYKEKLLILNIKKYFLILKKARRNQF